VTPEAAAGLRTLAEALPTGAAVPVPREWLLELLARIAAPAASGASSTPADLTVADLAARFGRKPSTIRGWLDRELIPGSYRFRGREWRVPAGALAAFEAGQRPKSHAEEVVPPRASRAREVDLGGWRTAS
jgi:hypothetical protein